MERRFFNILSLHAVSDAVDNLTAYRKAHTGLLFASISFFKRHLQPAIM